MKATLVLFTSRLKVKCDKEAKGGMGSREWACIRLEGTLSFRVGGQKPQTGK